MLRRRENNQQQYLKIILLGVLVNIFWITVMKTKPFSDFSYYHTLAERISKGGSFGSTYTSVGYPIVLGFIYYIFGVSVITAKGFNIVLSLINSILFYKFLKKIDIKDSDRNIILLIYVLFPANIYYNSLLCTEIIFNTLLLLILNVYFSKNKYKYFIVGILTAAASMVKPFFFIFFFAVFLIDSVYNKSLLKGLKNGLIVLVVSLICLTPWIIRNSRKMNQFTFISNNKGIVMYINNNSQNKNGMWMDSDEVEDSITLTEEYKKANMTKKNKMLYDASMDWIKHNPAHFLYLGIRRLINVYVHGEDIYFCLKGTNLINNMKFVYSIVGLNMIIKNILFIPFIIWCFIVLFITIKNLIYKQDFLYKKHHMFIVVLFFMLTCTYFITEGQPRYSFPLNAFAVYVSYFIYRKKGKFHSLTSTQ